MIEIENPVIVGLGEILWDVFPSGKRLGGAPVNFAFHCSQLGGVPYPVSSIGRDESGDEIEALLDSLGIDSSYIARDDSHPTGRVEVALDENGKPSYEICEDVAWDYVQMDDRIEELAKKADAVCFGSLAQRNEVSRNTIQSFLDKMRPGTLKIFDVNLRQNFYNRSILKESLQKCNVLKLNDDELPVLAEMFTLEGNTDDQLDQIFSRFDLRVIALTRGSNGSVLMDAEQIDEHPGYRGEVVDTVGAGDAFTAVLCMDLIDKESLSTISIDANDVASYVCSKQGATPALSDRG